MIDRRRLTQQGLGWALLFVWLFLALSLLGYRPDDPPGGASWRAEPIATRNPCGPVGAWLAHATFGAVGWGSALVVLGLAGVVVLAIARRPVPDPPARAVGFLLVVVVAAVAMAAGDARLGRALLRRSPPVGSGGYVGSVGAAFLGGQFGPVGMLLILGALAIVGARLCAEHLAAWPARELGALLSRRRRREPALPVGPPAPAAAPYRPALAGPHEPYRLLGGPSASASAPGAPPRPVLDRPAPLPDPRIAGPTAAAARPPRGAAAVAPQFARPADGRYVPPPLELLEPPAAVAVQDHESLIQNRALMLEKTLREHGCVVRVVQIDTGPVITMFEIELEAGLRVSRVIGLTSDLAIALGVPSVRVVYPLAGKSTVGLEVPNERRGVVRLSEVMVSTMDVAAPMQIPLFLGKDVKGTPLAYDLAKMPHLLIAGRTGTGKSVCLNAVITSLLMTRRPDEVKVILIDPKKVELSQFRRIPHLMHPVVTEMDKAEALLAWACEKMEERYALLERARVRSIHDYNGLGAEELYDRLGVDPGDESASVPTYLHSIVIIADELADMVMQNKEVETHIIRLAQKARAAGLHLILATQRPTVEIITGLIKSNMPARIAFQVTDRNNSRVVLDEMGAEKLLGNGDMLFMVPNTSNLVRAQGTYVSDAEINRVVAYLEQYPVEFSKELMKMKGGGAPGERGAGMKSRDDLYEAAVDIIIREGKGSTSLLQRALGIGYGRAARLIDFMAEDGIVGESKGSVARDVYYTLEEWEKLRNGDADDGEGGGGAGGGGAGIDAA
jgi:S-DNA-T family DNA segregation ATPase FtsK/SpoIIIE